MIKRAPDGRTVEAVLIESLFMIADKEGNDVDFKLQEDQLNLDKTLTGRDIIPKARQLGVSSYFLARYLAACLANRNTRAVVISHEEKATQRMLQKVHYMINHFKGPAPLVKNMSQNAITFPKMDSTFYIGTAGSKTFGRGDTITHLHCSEYAYWSNASALMKGLMQAVPVHGGEVAIESTGNGAETDYHKRCLRAKNGVSRYKLHFYNWLGFPEYRIPCSPAEALDIMSHLDDELEESEIVEAFNLDAEQLLFRRAKLEEFDYDLTAFKQEYPLTLEECFQASGDSLFLRTNYRPNVQWKDIGDNLEGLPTHPNPYYHYVAGVDVGAGVRKDNTVISVWCLETGEQVAEWVSNKKEPDFVGRSILPAVGRKYNLAYIVPESNNHGIVLIDELMDNYPRHMIFKDKVEGNPDKLMAYGFRTSTRSKPLLVGKFRRDIRTELYYSSPGLKSEMSTFVEDETGKLGAIDGCFDDRVIAAALAGWGFKKAALKVMEVKPQAPPPAAIGAPFSLEGIIARVPRPDSEDFPIKRQVQ